MKKTLSHDNFIKARDYIFAHSDDINRAWFHYNFEGEAFAKMQTQFEAHLTMLILAELHRFGRIEL